MIRVTAHAIKRYKQRVAMVTTKEVMAAIQSHESALDLADRLGGATVKLADGTRLIVADGCVKTVLGRDCRFNHPRKAA